MKVEELIFENENTKKLTTSSVVPRKRFYSNVTYKKEHSLSLDGGILSETICPNIHDILKDKRMFGLIKHAAWEYEKETRLCVILPRSLSGNYPSKIAIDFDGLDGCSLMCGPCLSPKRIDDLLEELKQNNLLEKIINSIRFDHAHHPQLYISGLADKLYLPAK